MQRGGGARQARELCHRLATQNCQFSHSVFLFPPVDKQAKVSRLKICLPNGINCTANDE